MPTFAQLALLTARFDRRLEEHQQRLDWLRGQLDRLAALVDGRDEDGLCRPRKPLLSVAQVLAWADAHHARTGQWPKIAAGSIPEAPGLKWARR